jgi:dihydrofolate reductase
MNKTNPPLVIVAALGRNSRVIGKNNQLLWHIPDDLKRFKSLTLGHPIIMGRKTFESILGILGKPLPGRNNIILTRQTDYSYPDTQTAHSLEEAIALAQMENPREIHIGGGAELYATALPQVSKLFLTLIDEDPEGDAFFPVYESDFLIINQSESKTDQNITYQWVDLVRRS